MFWILILIAGLVACFVKLGMYSVWMTVLFAGLKLAVIIIMFLVAAMVWVKVFKKHENKVAK
jgi:hypothetical protein